MAQSALSGAVQLGLEEMVKEYEKKFGLDKPLWKQYLTYLSDMSRFDFNYSIANYPRKVMDMIAEAIPWSFALLLVTTLLAFVIGNLLGALMAWPGAPKFLNYVMPPVMMLGAIPYFLLGLILVYIFGFCSGRLPDVRRLQDGHHPHAHASLHLGRRSGTPCCRRCRSSWFRWAAGRSACGR